VGFGCHDREVRIAELVGGGEPIQPARESRKLAVLDEPCIAPRMNTLQQGLTRLITRAVLTKVSRAV